MKKLFVDTNVIIDLISRRDPFFGEAAILFSLADKNLIQLSVSSLTIANTNYILCRQLNSNRVKTILRKLRIIVDVLSVDDKIVELALNDEDFSDFEDGLQYFTALENSQDIIVTRNLKDFNNSKLPAMTARQFIESMSKV